MARMSAMFSSLRANGASDQKRNVKVVIKLSDTATAGAGPDRVPIRDHGATMAMLGRAGIDEKRLSTLDVRQDRIRGVQSNVIFDLPIAKLWDLEHERQIIGIRPARIHTTFLHESVEFHGIDAGVHAQSTGEGVTVAVLDSGIDVDHPDFKNRIDLARSKNFTDEGAPDDVSDLNGHGTHVAGIIGGAGKKYRGVAPGVRFIICKVFDRDGVGTEGDIEEAVNFAVMNGADVINYSGGYGPVYNGAPAIKPPWVWPQDELDEEMAFRLAVESGTICVVSAGNFGHFGSGTITVPATSPHVISVASISKKMRPSGFSSIGPVWRSAAVNTFDMVAARDEIQLPKSAWKPDLAAIGGELTPFDAQIGGCYYDEGIVSCRTQSKMDPDTCDVNKLYTKMSGTSQSAPVITGLSALILERLKALPHINLPEASRRAKLVGNVLRVSSVSFNPAMPTPRNIVGKGYPIWRNIEEELLKIADGRTSVHRLSR